MRNSYEIDIIMRDWCGLHCFNAIITVLNQLGKTAINYTYKKNRYMGTTQMVNMVDR